MNIPALHTGLVSYKTPSCQRTTEMPGGTDCPWPWPPSQVLVCVSPLSKIWLRFSQLPRLWGFILMSLFEGDERWNSMSLSLYSLSQMHKGQVSPVPTKLWLAFFHPLSSSSKQVQIPEGFPKVTTILKSSWCPLSVPQLDASPSGLLGLIWLENCCVCVVWKQECRGAWTSSSAQRQKHDGSQQKT